MLKKKRRRRIVKRLYEEGKERTLRYVKKPASTEEKPKTPPFSLHKESISPPRTPEIKAPSIRETRREVSPLPPTPTPAPAPQFARPAHRTAQFSDNYELPSSYGVTRLTLMVKDPLWVYAYWEIAPSSILSLRNTLSNDYVENSRMVLRMYDVTLIDFNGSNANRYFDIEVGPNTNNWYMNLWSDSVSYIGELGLRGPDGRFSTLARSNCVHTPRAGYSPRAEQIWMKVTDEESPLPYVKFAKVSPRSKAARRRSAFAPLISKTKKMADGKKVFYLTEADIRRYYSRLNPLLKDIMLTRLGKHLVKLYGKKYAEKAGFHAFLLEGETEEDRQRVFSMIPKEYFIKRILLGSSQEFVLLGGASEKLVKGPGGASEFVQERVKAHKFFFELDTELIVYGRTEPDAEVWLKGKKITLSKDGTFSLRFSLPDGEIPLEFRAISGDKEEKRAINTYVERRTNYED